MIFVTASGSFKYDLKKIATMAHQRATSMNRTMPQYGYADHLKDAMRWAWNRAKNMMSYYGEPWVSMPRSLTEWINATPDHQQI